MQSEKMKKIGKWGIIIISCLIILFFVGWLIWGAMLMMTERRTERESTADYLISGGRTGCADEGLVSGSKEFLRHEFKAEVECCISKKRFLKKALSARGWSQEIGKEEYEKNYYNGKDGYEEWVKKCSGYENRIIDIINDLK